MLTKRLIACCDVVDGRVTKAQQFQDNIDVAPASDLARQLSNRRAPPPLTPRREPVYRGVEIARVQVLSGGACAGVHIVRPDLSTPSRSN